MSAVPGTEGGATTLNQSQEPAAPHRSGSTSRALGSLTRPPGSTQNPTSATPSPGRGGRGSLALLRSSDGEMDDTGFLQVQHTLKDSFHFFSSKRGFLEAELEAVSVNWGDGNGREENGAVVMGRAARALQTRLHSSCASPVN